MEVWFFFFHFTLNNEMLLLEITIAFNLVLVNNVRIDYSDFVLC